MKRAQKKSARGKVKAVPKKCTLHPQNYDNYGQRDDENVKKFEELSPPLKPKVKSKAKQILAKSTLRNEVKKNVMEKQEHLSPT